MEEAVGAVDYFIATALVEADERASARHRYCEFSLVAVSEHRFESRTVRIASDSTLLNMLNLFSLIDLPSLPSVGSASICGAQDFPDSWLLKGAYTLELSDYVFALDAELFVIAKLEHRTATAVLIVRAQRLYSGCGSLKKRDCLSKCVALLEPRDAGAHLIPRNGARHKNSKARQPAQSLAIISHICNFELYNLPFINYKSSSLINIIAHFHLGMFSLNLSLPSIAF